MVVLVSLLCEQAYPNMTPARVEMMMKFEAAVGKVLNPAGSPNLLLQTNGEWRRWHATPCLGVAL